MSETQQKLYMDNKGKELKRRQLEEMQKENDILGRSSGVAEVINEVGNGILSSLHNQ